MGHGPPTFLPGPRAGLWEDCRRGRQPEDSKSAGQLPFWKSEPLGPGLRDRSRSLWAEISLDFRMSFLLVCVNLLLLLRGIASTEEVRAHPFTDVILSCEFSFIDGTENLEFSWEREDLIEEYDTTDEDFFRFYKYYDFFQVFTKVVYQFHNNTEQLEEQNALYEGRVSVDQEEISDGVLSLLLRNVDFLDEALYKCSAVSPDGRGEITVKLTVEDSEMPQVQFAKMDEEDVVTCTSKGWYLTPNVTWLDRGERNLSNHSTVEILEEQMNGLHRVFSVLKYPVKLHEKYFCYITETDENHRPFRAIRRHPKSKFPQHDYY